MKVLLVGRDPSLVRAWRGAFEDIDDVGTALRHARGPARIPSFDQLHAVHAALRSA